MRFQPQKLHRKMAELGSTIIEYAVVIATLTVLCVAIFLGLGTNFFEAFAPFLAFLNFQSGQGIRADIHNSASGSGPSGGSENGSNNPGNDIPSSEGASPTTAGTPGNELLNANIVKLIGVADKLRKSDPEAANVLYQLARETRIMADLLSNKISLQDAIYMAQTEGLSENFLKLLGLFSDASSDILNAQLTAYTQYYEETVLQDSYFQELNPTDQQEVSGIVGSTRVVAAWVPLINEMRLAAGLPVIGQEQVAATKQGANGIEGIANENPASSGNPPRQD